jgi:hypothetical protein
MRTYYRGPDAVVTDTHFVWQGPTVRIFAIDELDNVRLVRAMAGGRSRAAVALGLGLSVIAVMAGLRFGLLAASPLIAALVVLLLAGARKRGGPAWEIRARYRAKEVTVFTSDDPRIFNQVTRALRRTIERRSRRQAYGLVAG